MSFDSPASVLFNRDGYDVVIADGYTIISGQSGIIMAGRNGSTAKFITLDGYGQTIVVGAGMAGSPSGGVVTIQGIVGGQAIPVSGNFTNPSVSLTSIAPPGYATYIGGLVNTSLPSYIDGYINALSLTTGGLLRVDGSNVTQPVSGTVTVVQPSASNLHALVVGAVADGYVPIGNPVLVAGWDGTNTRILRTATDGTVRIDPTGTTTQPVSQVGTWSVSQVTSPWITRDTIADGYLQSILANQTNGTQHTIVDGYVQTNPNVNATQAGVWTVQQGTPPWIVIGTGSDNTTNSTAKIPALVARANTIAPSWIDGYMVPLSATTAGLLRVDGSAVTQPISAISLPLPSGAATEATLLNVLTTSAFQARINTLGQKTMANSTPVVIASDQSSIPVTDNGGSLTIDNSTLSVVGGGTEATALRVTVANDSTGVLSVDDNGGSLTIDNPILSVVGGGTEATAQRVTIANDSTGVLSVDDNGASLTVDNPTLSVVGGGTEATAQRVTIANDSTGVLSVDDNGGSLTVDGTVTANQGTSPWVTNITQFGGSAIVAGTGISGAGIPRVTVSNDSNILATQSGTWIVQQGTPPWIVKDGYVTTAAPIYTNNTNNYLSLTTTGLLRVDGSNVTQPVSQSGTWTVQQGTPPWTISGIASDNTTNSTAKLPVLPARANASPPSWIDGYQVPLSTLLTGALRTDVTSWLGSIAPTVGQKVMASSIPVTIASNQAPIAVTFNVTGDTTGVSFGIRKLGGGSANVLFTMESTTYVEPTSAAQRSISSSSVNDTSAGTGARTVKITYYDNSGAGPFSETLTLNGTTAVNTVASDIRFIEKIEVITVGSGGANAGTITLYGATGGVGGTVGSIGIGNILTGIGDNKTLWAHHYVGAGLTAKFSVLVTGIQSGGSATNGTFFIRAINSLIANSAEILVADAVLVIGAFERIFTFNPTVSGFARITAYGIPGVNNSTMTCSFDWSEQ